MTYPKNHEECGVNGQVPHVKGQTEYSCTFKMDKLFLDTLSVDDFIGF